MYLADESNGNYRFLIPKPLNYNYYKTPRMYRRQRSSAVKTYLDSRNEYLL